ncbi:DUF5131 family protein [Aromatoleum toluclasticum]|uniref:DUF5131 family protein n=1 Tax=Aromatoleum toluclasticum TaxID=92003 RepID=UPI00037E93B8|nr:phage Gp37/Gp68 family protein [Aromatoleum toluclasticum]
MSDSTGIEWTDATWNPVTGCSKVSAGCKHCYAERDWARLSANKSTRYFGRKFTDVQCHDDVIALPLRWTKPRRIFVNSMSDLFHSDVPDAFIDRVFAAMALTPHHTYQVLTKRPERMRDYLSSSARRDDWARAGDMIAESMEPQRYANISHVGEPGNLVSVFSAWPLPNVWLGVSIEDQETAAARIPLLLDTPSAVRWISAEPLLGSVDLRLLQQPDGQRRDGLNYGLHWVVVGGESGPKSRPMHPQWARTLRDQCAVAGVTFLFKQWGEWAPRSDCYHTLTCGQAAAEIDPSATKWPCIRLTGAGRNGRDLANACDGDDCYMQKVGKKLAGRLLDGVLHDAYPEAFR